MKRTRRADAKRTKLTILVVAAIAVLALSRFGPSVAEKKTFYCSPVWSPDTKSVAYIKRSMEYSFTRPILRLPVLTPSRSYSFTKDSLELVIRKLDTKQETVIKKFTISKEKVSPTDLGLIDARLIWYLKGYLQYSVVTMGFAKELDSGNNFIRPDGTGETFTTPTWDARTKIVSPSPRIMKNMELYPTGVGSTIFLFDHDAKKVKRLLGNESEPLPKYRPLPALPDA